MPTYDYECEECGVQFDVRQSIKDDAYEYIEHIIEIPDGDDVRRCNGKVNRIITKCSFSLKGSGWTPKYHSN